MYRMNYIFGSSPLIYVKEDDEIDIDRQNKRYFPVLKETTEIKSSTFYLPGQSDITKYCLVQTYSIKTWIDTTTNTTLNTNLKKFDKTPGYKYYINCLLSIDSIPPKSTNAEIKNEYDSYIEKIDDESHKNDDTFNYTYVQHQRQFGYISDLKELIELGKLNLVSRLYQIRFESYDYPNNAPFPPEELDRRIASFMPEKKRVTISYLIEKYGKEDITEFIDNNYIYNYYKIQKIGEMYNEFVNAFVETGRIYTTSDFANIRVKRAKLTQKIESIGFLDIDCYYLIKNTSDDFKKHGKVYMKFLFFASLNLLMPNLKFFSWYVTKQDVNDMIVFFYKFDFMMYESNPINSLVVHLKKDKSFEGTCDKFKIRDSAELIAFFNDFIQIIPDFIKPAIVEKYDSKNQMTIPHLLENFGGKRSRRRIRKGKKSRRNHTSKRHRK